MTKVLKNGNELKNYLNGVLEKAKKESLPAITEQIYKDSEEFTYRDSGTMYDSGAIHSNFKEGIVIERTPYVRRRYYEGGNPGPKNRNAEAMWFDKTWGKYKKDYILMYASFIGKVK